MIEHDEAWTPNFPYTQKTCDKQRYGHSHYQKRPIIFFIERGGLSIEWSLTDVKSLLISYAYI